MESVTGASWVWLFTGGLSAVGLIAWMSRCHHRHPLSLLPPVVDELGVRSTAKWYCADCGKSWPAGMERDRAPIQRFSGYDQTKAVASARRADELEERQRELAMKRAGLTRKRVSPPPTALQQPSKAPVPIHGRRIAG
jgi:hypothetical protein